MRVGDDRHVDADHAPDLGRVHAAGVDHDVGADRALVGDDLVHPAVLEHDLDHLRPLLDVGAAQPRAVGQRERQLAGIEVAVLRDVGGGQHAVGAHRREQLLRLPGRHDLDRQAEALRPPRLALDLLVPGLRRCQPQAAQLVPAGILAGLLGQLGVEADRVLHHLGQADGRAQLADQAGRVPRRAVGQPVLLDQDDVRPAQLGEVVEDAAAADAASDDNSSGLRAHPPDAATTGIDRSSPVGSPATVESPFSAIQRSPGLPILGGIPDGRSRPSSSTPRTEDLMNRKHLTRPAAIAVVALLVAGSLAYAAWTVNGSGTGAASADQRRQPVADARARPSDALFPGASADVATTITQLQPVPGARHGDHAGLRPGLDRVRRRRRPQRLQHQHAVVLARRRTAGRAGTSPPTTRSTSTRPTRSRWAPAPTTPVRARRSPCT